MKQVLYFSFLTLILSISSVGIANARPVSYPGGWTVMVMNNKDMNSSHIHCTPSFKRSFGWRHEYQRGESYHADTLQHNELLKRWNAPASQANIYLKSGVGVAYDSHDQAPAAFTGLAADWEDRRYFISYENRFFWADDLDKFVRHNARIGIAPYIGDTGDLHTWLMLQADYDAGADDSFALTPLVRLFKGPTMVEAGYNLDDGILFNLIQRF